MAEDIVVKMPWGKEVVPGALYDASMQAQIFEHQGRQPIPKDLTPPKEILPGSDKRVVGQSEKSN